MPNSTITLSTATSSSPGASTPASLNWISGKPINVVIFSTVAASSIFFQVEFTFDDLTVVGGPSRAQWTSMSSAYTDTGITSGAASVFATSAITSNGMLFSFDAPIAAIRMNSSAMTSGPLTMKVIQGEGG
jgi:hypothetical protein